MNKAKTMVYVLLALLMLQPMLMAAQTHGMHDCHDSSMAMDMTMDSGHQQHMDQGSDHENHTMTCDCGCYCIGSCALNCSAGAALYGDRAAHPIAVSRLDSLVAFSLLNAHRARHLRPPNHFLIS